MMNGKSRRAARFSTVLTGVPVSLSRFFRLFCPILSTVTIVSAFPIRIVWASLCEGDRGALYRTKSSVGIAFLDNKFFATSLTCLFESCFFSGVHGTTMRAVFSIIPICDKFFAASFTFFDSALFCCPLFLFTSFTGAFLATILYGVFPRWKNFKGNAAYFAYNDGLWFSTFPRTVSRLSSAWIPNLGKNLTATFAGKLLRRVRLSDFLFALFFLFVLCSNFIQAAYAIIAIALANIATIQAGTIVLPFALWRAWFLPGVISLPTNDRTKTGLLLTRIPFLDEWRSAQFADKFLRGIRSRYTRWHLNTSSVLSRVKGGAHRLESALVNG